VNADDLEDLLDPVVSVFLDRLIYAHRLERDRIAQRAPRATLRTFSRTHALGPDLRAIHLPGHSRGFTAYLWSPGDSRRHLFAGDMLGRRDAQWTAYLEEPDLLDPMLRSLQKLARLDVDDLLPNQSPAAIAVPMPFDGKSREAAIREAAQALRTRHA
jgi:glyoxylase-like metal-dependent hydrolase (beta-lactamase superfamily II)